jgi:SAM-dependent methyltransferase
MFFLVRMPNGRDDNDRHFKDITVDLMNGPRPLYRVEMLLWILFCCFGRCVGAREAFLSTPATFLDRAGAGRCGGRAGVGLLHSHLIPQENPNANLESRSKSGVRYQSVLTGLHKLIPPDELEQRHAVSRTDGYWPFIRTGEEPPLQLTYGEFDFYFFAQLLDRAWEHYCDSSTLRDNNCHAEGAGVWKNQVFIDVGSGAGRLVLAAAALHPTGWKQCRGVELLPGLHKAASENLAKCRLGDDDSLALPVGQDDNDDNANTNPEFLKLAPIDFACASFEDPAIESHWKDASCIFVTASCLPSELLQSLSQVVGRQCRPGTIVMSTDYPLPLQGSSEDNDGGSSFRLELLEQVDGYSWVTGGDSTAYIHRVVES